MYFVKVENLQNQLNPIEDFQETNEDFGIHEKSGIIFILFPILTLLADKL